MYSTTVHCTLNFYISYICFIFIITIKNKLYVPIFALNYLFVNAHCPSCWNNKCLFIYYSFILFIYSCVLNLQSVCLCVVVVELGVPCMACSPHS